MAWATTDQFLPGFTGIARQTDRRASDREALSREITDNNRHRNTVTAARQIKVKQKNSRTTSE